MAALGAVLLIRTVDVGPTSNCSYCAEIRERKGAGEADVSSDTRARRFENVALPTRIGSWFEPVLHRFRILAKMPD